jgi:hypothetical protein
VLTVGYSNTTSKDMVQAQVMEIDPATGQAVSTSCIAANPATPASGTASCSLGRFSFDFSRFFYQVLVTISRTSDTQLPQANGVSLR